MPRDHRGRAPPGKRERPAAATWGVPENINNSDAPAIVRALYIPARAGLQGFRRCAMLMT
jgi:hypothetical protein